MNKWLNPPVEIKKFNIFIKQNKIEQQYKKQINVSDYVHVSYLLNGKEIH